jgi:hypothetical protein
MKASASFPRLLSRRPTLMCRRGSAILAVLLGVLLMGLLVVMYMRGGGGMFGLPPGVSPFQRMEQTRNSVCEINRKTLATEIITNDLNPRRGVDPARLQQIFASRRTCPGEGKCYYADDEIYCTQHTPTPRFRDMLYGG